MKKIFFAVAVLGLALSITSCSLEKTFDTGYSNPNISDSEGLESPVKTREDLRGQLDGMYSFMRGDDQQLWYRLITLSDTRADNAYGCPGEVKVMAVENNNIDSDNEFASSSWDQLMKGVTMANQVICNADYVKQHDSTLTDTEYQEWLSEALCFRAYNWIMMMQLFGTVPMVTEIPPAINNDNIVEVYPLYYPKRVSNEEMGAQLVADVEDYACQYAPAVDVTDKYKITKGFAHGLMARFYSLKQFRNWTKVIEHCQAVEGMNYTLCPNYGDLWAFTPGEAGMATQNTSESIFEVSWAGQNTGSWMWMMFYRNAYKPDDSFSWGKWCTPSRNITEAYQAEGDTERLNASIAFDKCGWTYQYPADNFAFMHKFPTNVTPVYVMRLAEIKLLHAEALANTNDPNGAADLVDEIRARAQIAPLTAAQRASAEEMRKAVLHEQRLELAFEGFRWFDLVRYGEDYAMLKQISDGVNIRGAQSYDSYYKPRKILTDNYVILPVPTQVLNKNSSIEQNLGY